jgi:hypothetical protein
MTRKEALKILHIYQKWRRGSKTIPMPHPKEIGIAIDVAIRELRKIERYESKG